MSDRDSAPKPAEREAVITTIVGGRPPGCGQSVGSIPRGVEVLLKKASVDAEFKTLLLRDRADAAREIGLDLTPSEQALLKVIPAAQLETIIANTRVRADQRPAFLGRAAAAMLLALGLQFVGCNCDNGPTKGSRPDLPTPPAAKPTIPDDMAVSRGIRPDLPPNLLDEGVAGTTGTTARPKDIPVTKGIRPDRPVFTDEFADEGAKGTTGTSAIPPSIPTSRGIRPDRPLPKLDE